MNFMNVMAILAAIAATVLLCIKVLPAKKDGTFSKKLLQHTYDYFNFKKLYLEQILKILFAFLTIASILVGVISATLGNFIQFIGNLSDAIKYEAYDYMSKHIWTALGNNFLRGIAIAVLGPIVLRLVYELLMMFVLLVKNVIDINGKLKGKIEEPKEEPVEE